MEEKYQNLLRKFRTYDWATTAIILLYIVLLTFFKEETNIIIPIIVVAFAPVVSLKGLDFKLETLELKNKRKNMYLKFLDLVQNMSMIIGILISFISNLTVMIPILLFVVSILVNIYESFYIRKSL